MTNKRKIEILEKAKEILKDQEANGKDTNSPWGLCMIIRDQLTSKEYKAVKKIISWSISESIQQTFSLKKPRGHLKWVPFWWPLTPAGDRSRYKEADAAIQRIKKEKNYGKQQKRTNLSYNTLCIIGIVKLLFICFS